MATGTVAVRQLRLAITDSPAEISDDAPPILRKIRCRLCHPSRSTRDHELNRTLIINPIRLGFLHLAVSWLSPSMDWMWWEDEDAA